jgi:hypothetical protein
VTHRLLSASTPPRTVARPEAIIICRPNLTAHVTESSSLVETNNVRIGSGSLGGHAQRQKHIDNEPVATTHPFGEQLSGFRQKNSTTGATRCKSLTLQPRNRLDGGRVGRAETAGDIGRARLAAAGRQVRNEFDIVPTIQPQARVTPMSPGTPPEKSMIWNLIR